MQISLFGNYYAVMVGYIPLQSYNVFSAVCVINVKKVGIDVEYVLESLVGEDE